MKTKFQSAEKILPIFFVLLSWFKYRVINLSHKRGGCVLISYVFKRFELKYLLTAEQYRAARSAVESRLSPDAFGKTTIQSLYYDTPDDRLVRSSIEKPVFKEKLRLRAYGLSDDDKNIYVEMKRKYDDVVYKRRLACTEREAERMMSGGSESQIGRELDYFFKFYGVLSPKILILYDREAFFDSGSDLRVTFDQNVRYRKDNLNLHTSLDGEKLLPNGTVLMEIKSGTAFPLWLCDMLCKEKIKKQSFSKYGAAYEREYRKNTVSRSNILCLNPFSAAEPLPQSASLSY